MNYRKHLSELKSSESTEPVLFIKPDSSLSYAPANMSPTNNPFFLPEFSDEIYYETEIVVKICKLGKNISEKFAHRYYKDVTVGLDLTARDLQKKLSSSGMPWEISKGFDQSAVLGQFQSLEKVGEIQNLNFHLDINGNTVQKGCTTDMTFTVNQVIAYASRFFTLKIGDLIYTGTPSGVGRINTEDHLEGYLMGKKILDLRIK